MSQQCSIPAMVTFADYSTDFFIYAFFTVNLFLINKAKTFLDVFFFCTFFIFCTVLLSLFPSLLTFVFGEGLKGEIKRKKSGETKGRCIKMIKSEDK